MIGLEDLLKAAAKSGASDLHITVGLPPMLRVTGKLSPIDELKSLTADDTERLVMSMIRTCGFLFGDPRDWAFQGKRIQTTGHVWGCDKSHTL